MEFFRYCNLYYCCFDTSSPLKRKPTSCGPRSNKFTKRQPHTREELTTMDPNLGVRKRSDSSAVLCSHSCFIFRRPSVFSPQHKSRAWLGRPELLRSHLWALVATEYNKTYTECSKRLGRYERIISSRLPTTKMIFVVSRLHGRKTSTAYEIQNERIHIATEKMTTYHEIQISEVGVRRTRRRTWTDRSFNNGGGHRDQ